MRTLAPLLFVLFAACSGDGSNPDSAACELADTYSSCDDCYDGEVACSYDGVTEVRGSCADCQAKGQLYQRLCDEGVDATADELEADTVCVSADCVVLYPSCQPCMPVCQSPDVLQSTTCPGLTCTSGIEDPPGECVWEGSGCAFVE